MRFDTKGVSLFFNKALCPPFFKKGLIGVGGKYEANNFLPRGLFAA